MDTKLIMVSVYFNGKHHTKFVTVKKGEKPSFNVEKMFNIPSGYCIGIG